MDATDKKVSYQGQPREQRADPQHSQKTQGSGTGGGGSGPAAPQPTAEAPSPKGGSEGRSSVRDRSGSAGAQGVSSVLEPGGTRPSNEALAGEGRIGTRGAS